MVRTYSELIKLPTFEERFEYLKIGGKVGKETFGLDRFINQMFYKSKTWKKIRRDIVTRDFGCDLGLEGYEVSGIIIVHHMNPLNRKDILERTDYLLNPEYLICTSLDTHNGIHYGQTCNNIFVERRPNDTCPWK